LQRVGLQYASAVAKFLLGNLMLVVARQWPILHTNSLQRGNVFMLKTMCSIAALGVLTVIFGQMAVQGRPPSRDIELRVLSGRPDMVSGGDALIQITSSDSVPLQKIAVMVNGKSVTAEFRPDASGKSLVGRVEGLVVGSNKLEASLDGKTVGPLMLINHVITGPILSGPHQAPFVCQTEAAGLGPALDADCGAKTNVSYLYKSTEPPAPRPATRVDALATYPAGFKPYDPSAPRPADLAQTTTSDGKTVDYIVRRETGVINRAIYQIAFLHQPGQPLPDPWTSTPGWNRRLVYVFGPGVRAGYRQGAVPSAVDDQFLAHGYAVAVSSLSVFGTNADDVLSAECMMMVKEHFIKQFGTPRFTMGFGGSGGSMQQHMVAQNYPGLLEGIIPGRSFSDTMSFLQPLFDCELMVSAINTSKLSWTPEQKTAVSGKRDFSYCTTNGSRYPNLRATNCDPATLTPAMVYNAASNPKGARCTYQDNMVNIFGRDPKTGFARSPFDNVGVQYGLRAFNEGKVTFEQFADLNEHIGGHDIDGNLIAAREVADPEALKIAYQTGRVNEGGGGLATIPIVDLRSYLDVPYADGTSDVHDAYRSGVTRARLVAANGNANNQVIVTVASVGNLGQDQGGIAPLGKVTKEVIAQLDNWIVGIQSDTSNRPPAEKVARNKPSELVDSCYDEKVVKFTDPVKCSQMFPYASDPRLVAGAPAADDIFKCALKPVSAKDYKQTLTAEQISRLKSIFPQGVCDYSRPGVSQQRVTETWQKY
jgi:hypothetical protein